MVEEVIIRSVHKLAMPRQSSKLCRKSRSVLTGLVDVANWKNCPLMHPGSDPSIFSTLGKVLSHGYLQCGFLPLRIAFPTLTAMLLGTSIHIPNSFLVSSFVDSLNKYEPNLFKASLKAKKAFSADIHTKLVAIISRFGGRELPNLAAVSPISSGLCKLLWQ